MRSSLVRVILLEDVVVVSLKVRVIRFSIGLWVGVEVLLF